MNGSWNFCKIDYTWCFCKINYTSSFCKMNYTSSFWKMNYISSFCKMNYTSSFCKMNYTCVTGFFSSAGAHQLHCLHNWIGIRQKRMRRVLKGEKNHEWNRVRFLWQLPNVILERTFFPLMEIVVQIWLAFVPTLAFSYASLYVWQL